MEENSTPDNTPLVKKQETTEIPKRTSEIPKYLEIICDSYLTNFGDGYEIPRSSMRKSAKKTDNIETNRSRTFSNSSTLSNESVVSTSKLNRESSESVQKTDIQKS